jgi:hypothetical protein
MANMMNPIPIVRCCWLVFFRVVASFRKESAAGILFSLLEKKNVERFFVGRGRNENRVSFNMRSGTT